MCGILFLVESQREKVSTHTNGGNIRRRNTVGNTRYLHACLRSAGTLAGAGSSMLRLAVPPKVAHKIHDCFLGISVHIVLLQLHACA